MNSKRSEPRTYPYPPPTIFAAVTAGLPQTKLVIRGADPNQGTIWAEKGMSALSWGEKVTVYVYPAANGQAAVSVDSELKFGLVAWGAHDRNFEMVFDAINRGLYQQAGPPPAQPQPSPPQWYPAPGPPPPTQ